MSRKQILTLRLIGVFLMLLGLALAVGSWHVSERKQAIMDTGKETWAVVVKTEQFGGRPTRRQYYVALQYSPEGADSVTQKTQVPFDVYAIASETHELLIRYDPADPREIVFVDIPYEVVGRYIAGAALLCIGLLVAIVGFWLKAVTPQPRIR